MCTYCASLSVCVPSFCGQSQLKPDRSTYRRALSKLASLTSASVPTMIRCVGTVQRDMFNSHTPGGDLHNRDQEKANRCEHRAWPRMYGTERPRTWPLPFLVQTGVRLRNEALKSSVRQVLLFPILHGGVVESDLHVSVMNKIKLGFPVPVHYAKGIESIQRQ